jgi:hypothetical protein
LARAGSPTSAATSAICGAFDMHRIWTPRRAIATGNASLAAEANRVQNGWTGATGVPMLRPSRG